MVSARSSFDTDNPAEIDETHPGSAPKPFLTALVFLEFVAVFCAVFTVAMVLLT